MKTNIRILSTLLLCLIFICPVRAEDGTVVKSATGTSTATAYFAGGRNPFKLLSLDVTSDLSSSTLSLAAGTYSLDVLKAATSGATNVICKKNSSLASNDVVLIRTAADSVIAATVWTNTLTTNRTINLTGPLNTNLAVGDVIRERLTVPYTVLANAGATATTIYVDDTTGLTGSDTLVLYRPGLPLLSQTVSSVASATKKRATLATPILHPVKVGDTIYERTLTSTNILGITAANGTNIHVAGTNGIPLNAKILVVAATGNMAVLTVNAVSTTNISVTTGPTFALAVGDRVWQLTTQTYTAIYPSYVGDTTCLIDVSTGLVAGDNLLFVPTGYAPFLCAVTATPSSETVKSIVVNTTFGVVVPAGSVLYEASTTTLTVQLAALSTDYAVVCDVSTSVVNADRLIIIPASGGVFENMAAGSPVDFPISTVTTTAATGLAVAAGDTLWKLGTATAFPVGATTLRRDGTAIYSADPGRPIRAVLTGTSACTINNLTGNYAQ